MVTKEIVTIDESISHIGRRIGKTPLHKFDFPFCNLYAKIEHHNLFGSIKDRPAYFIISKAYKDHQICKDTTIIESTSGNFGIGLAGICKAIGIKFIPVIDPCIADQKERILRLIATEVIKVQERDATGGFLLTRIKTVRDLMRLNPGCFNPNQYDNPNNYLSYYYTLGQEICNEFSRLDYAFICVSSGGTIIGLSNRLKEEFPDIKIIAVDIEGSMIFSNEPKVRKISGLGSSMRSPLMSQALIDDVIILSSGDIVKGVHELLQEHSLFLGASSGAAYIAAKMFLAKHSKYGENAIFISPDSGSAYLDSVYSDDWVRNNT